MCFYYLLKVVKNHCNVRDAKDDFILYSHFFTYKWKLKKFGKPLKDKTQN